MEKTYEKQKEKSNGFKDMKENGERQNNYFPLRSKSDTFPI
jgi:hypothetical protein